ncbi:1432_t:CDS:2 [Paraglomus brasilianum]|uniref:1432_t:CDS:1 n=1 Tax=Paraglomus brasilianum TaxID=144538 RepID=A0A9N9G825_9GLOM|nr:1432_t:CDS:2 [Paraglomus brasilianum]
MAVIYFKSQSSLGKLSMKKWMSPNELKNGTEDLIEFEER